MQGKIAIEEHFAIPETLEDSHPPIPERDWPAFSKIILDLMDKRLEIMDKNGIDMMILSLNAPAVQAIYNRQEAIDVARKANDAMAEACIRFPKKYKAFAALPLQDPDAAILELQRCVKDMGFVGALVNGYSQIDTPDQYKYLDDPIYRPFWAEVEKLDVPFYNHPREPMPCNAQQIAGHPWLAGAAWTFGVEAAVHTLRLMCSGLFDEFPKLKYIMGHLGECLPFCIWRTQHQIDLQERGMPAKKPLWEYMSENFWYTTSGQYRLPALLNTMMEFGFEKILFATDFPFEQTSLGASWMDTVNISENDRKRIGRQNAIDLFNLDL